ncbi:MAG: hypothetical protein H0U69_06770 [Trueperaceae bacterium]|nr:hypothetical protein [Trueperaceae bacterium]
MTPSKRTAYFVPHTHWDREWYQPFQVFRSRLVDVIDRVLELLRDERYRRFTLDGQAVVLDDYLEVRPERRGDIETHVRSGRLRIGPWYVLADEFLVSPEALIRNLALGRATCLAFGSPMPVAYTPDSFGHVSQLPLIVRGFGMDAIVFERGVGDEGERLRGEFEWRAADGVASVFAVHLLGTYSSAAAIGHLDWELGDAYDPERAVHQADAVIHGTDHLGEEFPRWLRESVERVDGGMAAYATGEALLLLNGSDHLFPQPNVPEIIADLNAAFEHVDFVHADVEEFVTAARGHGAPLETHQGEFRGSRYQHVLAGVLSARMYLKQHNHRAETLLERYAEPMSALAAASGEAAPDASAFLRSAWRTLLLNHAHDSICGCSVDAVHREMETRSAQVLQQGDDLCRRAVDHIAGHRDDPRSERTDTRHLALFNPLPSAVDAVLETTLVLPSGSAEGLRVIGPDGAALPIQYDVQPTTAPGDVRIARDTVHLSFAAALPPLSLTSARIETGERADDHARATRDDGPAAVRCERRGSLLVLEHETLRVEIDDHGAVVVHDRTSGRAHALDLCLVDEADAGDEYDFSPLVGAEHHGGAEHPGGAEPIVIRAPVGPATPLHTGPVHAAARIEYRFDLPERLADDRRSRIGRVEHDVALELALDAGAHRLDLSVRLHNHASDHRLRLRIATRTHADRVWADGHFHVLERPVDPPAGTDWFQRPTRTNHQRRFVAVQGDDGGVAVLNRGLPEYEAHATADGVDLSITLLRAVGWLSRDDLASRPQGAGPALPTPEAQCLGPHRFELAIVPFAGRWWEGALIVEAERFVAPPRAFASARPVEAHGVELDAPLTLSAYAPPEDAERGTIVRVWNPAPVDVAGRIRFHHPLHEVHLVRLDGTREARLDHDAGGIDVSLRPAGVLTLELVRARKEAEP